MNRIYEEMFIVRPDAAEEVIDAAVEQLSTSVKSAGGQVDKVDKWGKRRLAYKIEKFDEGFYVLMQITCKPETVRELERRLRVNDQVIKFLTVRIDERLKVAEKRKKKEEKRLARRPPRPEPSAVPAAPQGPGAPVMPAAPAAPMPGAPASAEAAAPEAAAPVAAAPVVTEEKAPE
jgi:small subunit ribosomal protein S6